MTDTLVRMPKLADTLVEGTVARWLKQLGDSVAAGEPLAAIETDKVTTELTSPAAGSVLELLVAEGATVPVETAIARIGAAGSPSTVTDAPESVTRTVTDGPESVTRTVTPVTPTVTPVTGVPAKATPVAQRLLAEHGLAPDDISAGKRVTKADVLRFLERPERGPRQEARPPGEEPQSPRRAQTSPHQAPPAQTPPAARQEEQATRHEGWAQPREHTAARRAPQADLVPLTSMRKAIAEHMVRASQTIPHGQTVMQADLTALAAWRDQHKAGFEAEFGAPLTFTVLFVHALARALAVRQRPVDVGVAVALDLGLIVPVIRFADGLTLGETARALVDLASRARSSTLQPAETQGALMTVTNVGSFGNLFASPIVPLQQIGILGPGLVEHRPLPAADGGIRIGSSCWLTLMFDRRAFDDLGADRLLRSVVEYLVSVAQPQSSESPGPSQSP